MLSETKINRENTIGSWLVSTACFADLDQGSKMIILETILTTFIASIVFRGRWGGTKHWLELKIVEPQ